MGAGWAWAGTKQGGAYAGWQYLVRAVVRVTHTLCRVGEGQQYAHGAGEGQNFQPAQSSNYTSKILIPQGSLYIITFQQRQMMAVICI